MYLENSEPTPKNPTHLHMINLSAGINLFIYYNIWIILYLDDKNNQEIPQYIYRLFTLNYNELKMTALK